MKHVFISYQHEDGDFADTLIQEVQKAGYATWKDDDQLQAGTHWRESIDNAIKNSCALIVIMSPAAKASEYVTYEWVFAWAAGIKVIPVVYKHTPLHPRLDTLHYLDFTIRNARRWDRLIEIVKNATEALETADSVPNSQPLSFSPISEITVQLRNPSRSLSTRKTPEQLLEEGDILYEVADYTKALATYKKALRLEPDNAHIHKKIGDALTQLTRYVEAIKAYKKAVHLQPDYTGAYFAQSEPYGKLEQYEKALDACEQALLLDPDNADAHNNKGIALKNLNHTEVALAAYEQAIRLDPGYALAYSARGSTLGHLELYEEALAACEQAIQLDPKLAIAYHNKSAILFNLKRHEDALVARVQAISFDASNTFVYKFKQFVQDIPGIFRKKR